MISVSDFANHASLWHHVAPTLEQVVRWSNSQQNSLGSAPASMGRPARRALISETAFRLTAAGYSPQSFSSYSLEDDARSFISMLPRGHVESYALTPIEWHDVKNLSVVINKYLGQQATPVFFPAIPGCGIVDSARADILIEDNLVEVKAVTRQFRALDFRQVLTYSAMLYASKSQIRRITLLNPRRARYVTGSLDELSMAASGRSAPELMQDLVNSMIGLQVSG